MLRVNLGRPKTARQWRGWQPSNNRQYSMDVGACYKTPSSSEEHIHDTRVGEKFCPDLSREQLRRWKSLEGDWRTFKDSEGNQSLHSDDAETTSSDTRFTPDPKFEGEYDEEDWRSVSRASTHEDRVESRDERLQYFNASPAALRLFSESVEKSAWSSDPAGLLSSRYGRDRYMTRRPNSRTGVTYSYDSFRLPLQTQNRQELHDAVNSSYPLLKENLSLLQKLKKERDVCRQLENDMKDLEGQIQDVSKSFELESGDIELRESREESEVGYSSEAAPNSPRLSSSFDHIYDEEEVLEGDYRDETNHIISETDPLIVIESTFSRLLHLAERLESAVREIELEEQLHRDSALPMHTFPREWLRVEGSRELYGMPAKLMSLLNELQVALRALLASKEWHRCREPGEEDCSSPASFTFHGFSDSRVIVPTVRTIFSPVGNSVEMRPVAVNETRISPNNSEEPERVEEFIERIDSPNSESSCLQVSLQDLAPDHILPEPNDDLSHEGQLIDKENCSSPTSENEQDQKQSENGGANQSEHPTDSPLLRDTQVVTPRKSLDLKPAHERCTSEITYPTNYLASTEIIKRIERLQELVKPELCESLKQRALKIQRAKEEFLSGVSMPNVGEEASLDTIEGANDIVIDKLSLPNGLTVKEQTEERKTGMFEFLRKRKKESWSSEELCRESLILEDKSDWLRNPFRPKGKYKINK